MFRLDQFMRVCQEDVPLPNGDKVTVRILSELENNARRDYGIAEAMRVSEQLKNPETELYQTKVAPLKDASIESVIDVLSQGRIYELVREANDLYRMDFIVPRDNSTLLEDVDTTLAQKTREDEVYAARAKHLLDGIKVYKDKVSALPRDVLNREIEARAQQVYSQVAARDAELYYTIWCAVIDKDGKRYFKNASEVRNLPGSIVSYLSDKYAEVDAIDPWEVTKSLAQGDSVGVGEDHPVEPVPKG